MKLIAGEYREPPSTESTSTSTASSTQSILSSLSTDQTNENTVTIPADNTTNPSATDPTVTLTITTDSAITTKLSLLAILLIPLLTSRF